MTAETQERCSSEPGSNTGKASVCIGCGEGITDPYILRVAPDLEWHADCLRCVECSRPLDESCTCFVRSGRTYCKQDYTRLFSGLRKCARCAEEFQSTDFVMRARDKIFHVDCFKCTSCSRLLMTGEEFALKSDGPLCKADHECIEKNSIQDGNVSDGSSGDGTVYTRKTPTPSGSGGSGTGGGSNNNNDAKNTSMESTDSVKSEPSRASGTRERRGKDSKPTRVRTVLNEKQLHTLRTCYGANPRPDALMKEQLVEMTSLSPRVIRVWFQNKRCKDKKRTILMKQIVESQEKNGRLPANMQGMPMVASSPVRHESSLQANPVEVQTYQQNWEAVIKYQNMAQHELEPSPYPPSMGMRYEETPTGMSQESPFLTPPNSASKEGEGFNNFIPHRLHMMAGEMAHCVM